MERSEASVVSSVSERVAAEHAIDPQLLSEIHALERMALGRALAVATNGKFPHWTVERWLSVLTFVGGVVVSIFFFGGEWTHVKQDVQRSTADIAAIGIDISAIRKQQTESEQKLDALKQQIETIEMTDEYYRTHPRRPPVLDPK